MSRRKRTRGVRGGHEGAAKRTGWHSTDGVDDGHRDHDARGDVRRPFVDIGRSDIGRSDIGQPDAGSGGQRPVAGNRQDLRTGARRVLVGPRGRFQDDQHRRVQRCLEHDHSRSRIGISSAGQRIRGVVQRVGWYQRAPHRHRQPRRRTVQRGTGNRAVLPERLHGGRGRHGARPAGGARSRTVRAGSDQRVPRLQCLVRCRPAGRPDRPQHHHGELGMVRGPDKDVPTGGQESRHGRDEHTLDPPARAQVRVRRRGPGLERRRLPRACARGRSAGHLTSRRHSPRVSRPCGPPRTPT